jgi:hypothetical protein
VAGKHARVLFEMQGNEPVALRVKVADVAAALHAILGPDSGSPPTAVIRNTPAEGTSVSGILRRISLTDREIIVIGSGPTRNAEVETTFSVPDNVKISQMDRTMRLEDLHEGQHVTVTGEKRDGRLEAKAIEAAP